MLALELDAQDVQHVLFADHRVQVIADRYPQLLDAGRNQRRRPADGDRRAQLGQAPDVGARHPRVQDVADQADPQPLDRAAFADRVDVEQPLRGVLVHAVAGVDHAGIEHPRQQVGGARGVMADHHRVDLHRLDGAGGVGEALPLLRAGGRAGQVDGVGRQPLGGQLEAGAGAGGRLEEQVGDGLALQRRDLLDLARGDLLERVGGIEQQLDLLARQVLQGEQVLARPADLLRGLLGRGGGCGGRHHAEASLRSISTSSTPSVSVKRTRIFSSRAVGMFLPT